jgi:hypothetical protein
MPQSIRVPSSSPFLFGVFAGYAHTHTQPAEWPVARQARRTAFIDFPEVPLISPKASAEAELVSVSPR